MARQSAYNLDEFRKLVLEGKSKAQIMQEMGIKGYPQFSALELRLIKTDKKFYEISRSSDAAIENTLSIGKRGNLVIPKKMIETSKFKAGAKFNVNFRGKKIILTLLED